MFLYENIEVQNHIRGQVMRSLIWTFFKQGFERVDRQNINL